MSWFHYSTDVPRFRLRGRLLTYLQLQVSIASYEVVKEKNQCTISVWHWTFFGSNLKVHIGSVLRFRNFSLFSFSFFGQSFRSVTNRCSRKEPTLWKSSLAHLLFCLFIQLCLFLYVSTESDLVFDFDGERFAIPPIDVPGGQMYLIFTSNHVRTYSGFKATTKKFQVNVGK